jgi:hypothetical protein
MRIDRRLGRTATAALAAIALASLAACGSTSTGHDGAAGTDFGSLAAGSGHDTGGHSSASSKASRRPKPPPLKVASVTPKPGSHNIDPTQKLTITLNRPIRVDSPHPSINPRVPGRWIQTLSTTYVFAPSSPYPPDAGLTVTLPGGKQGLAGNGGSRLSGNVTEHWQVRGGSTLRAQQILARLGYLPVDFDASDQPATEAAEAAAAYDPPDGHFAWRWQPAPGLSNLWAPGKRTVLTQGAVMTYEHDRGLAVDGIAGHDVWAHLMADDLADRHAPNPYTYVAADLSLPQRLTVYQNGSPVISSPVNSGVAGARTPTGTWPIYARYTSITMSGTNPDGSHYRDPGVPWSNFFNGGDAVHGFPRSSYGYPQSVGCLELPVGTAHRVYDTVGYGTLVTTYGDPTQGHARRTSAPEPTTVPSSPHSSSAPPPSAGPSPPPSPSTSPSSSPESSSR